MLRPGGAGSPPGVPAADAAARRAPVAIIERTSVAAATALAPLCVRHRAGPLVTIMDSYYQHHVFFCLNQREPGAERPSCAQCDAQTMQEYAKKRVKELGLAGPGKVRINKAGCLDRCEEGPVMVVYPEGTWYTYVDQADIDEIVESHLRDGKVVERLKI